MFYFRRIKAQIKQSLKDPGITLVNEVAKVVYFK